MPSDGHLIAWAAGLFEGEGCISIDKGRQNRFGAYASRVRLRITMTDKDVIEKFRDIVGYGNICVTKKPGSRLKQQWGVSIDQKDEVIRIINLFLPYFGERRKIKALEALAVIEETTRLRELNQKRYNHKLQIEDVQKIRQFYQENLSQKEIAQMFNIDRSTVSRIVNKKKWASV